MSRSWHEVPESLATSVSGVLIQADVPVHRASFPAGSFVQAQQSSAISLHPAGLVIQVSTSSLRDIAARCITPSEELARAHNCSEPL